MHESLVLLGFALSDDLMREAAVDDAFPQMQTHKFAWSMLHAFEESFESVSVVSAAPASDYPKNPRVRWPGVKFEQGAVDGETIPFINLLFLKQLTRYMGARRILRRRFESSPPSWLAVHGVHTPFLWCAVWSSRRRSTRTVAILTDPPGVVLAADGRLRRCLKRLDASLTKVALRHFDAVISLSDPLAADFAAGVPALVMEGLAVLPRGGDETQEPEGDHPTIVYAGGLTEEYGVRNLVEAFRSLPDPELRLELYGRGRLEGWIEQQARTDMRISGPFFVDQDHLLTIYSRATLLVQPRPLGQDFVRYSFPSKLMEYMASGTVVISTRLPSIPSDYEEYLVWCDESPEGIRGVIHEVLHWPDGSRRRFGTKAADFILSTRDPTRQGRRIAEFLRTVTQES